MSTNESTNEIGVGYGTCSFCQSTCVAVATTDRIETVMCRGCVTRSGGEAVALHIFGDLR